MKRQMTIGYLLAVILLIALPTAASLTWYQITKDPLVRPLGITEQALNEFYGFFGAIEITAIVDYDPARSGRVGKDNLRRALIRAFDAKGVEVNVKFRSSQRGTYVTYKVGASTIGPYPQSRAAEGIGMAVEAYRMYVPYKP